ncbi:MAG: Got1/Sft2-like family vesicle transport protein [Bacteroidales bacterium]|nr:Got1/Sft2-like family vesicle transport protein [Bacteroidales bacterium]
MEQKKTSKSTEETIGSNVRQYVNMQVDRLALRGAERISWFTSKVIVTVIYIVSAMVLFLTLCFALSYYFGELLGSTALGFLCTSGIVVIFIAIVYLLRKRLFANRMAKMYTKLLLGDEKTMNMDELKHKEELISARIESKEEVIIAEYNSFKSMVNPKNWVNSIKEYFMSKRAEKEEAPKQEHASHTAHTEAKAAEHPHKKKETSEHHSSAKKSDGSSHKKDGNYQEKQW